MNAFRQNVLLEAELHCIELIYRTKLNEQLKERLNNVDRLLTATNQQIEHSHTGILSHSDLNATEIKTIQHKLDELNGGIPLNTSGIGLNPEIVLQRFEEIDSLIEENDPVVKSIRQEREISATQLSLTKSLSLPKLEGGYQQQAILGQTYEGFHFGMTTPLWKNKNRVKTQRAKLVLSELAIQNTAHSATLKINGSMNNTCIGVTLTVNIGIFLTVQIMRNCLAKRYSIVR